MRIARPFLVLAWAIGLSLPLSNAAARPLEFAPPAGAGVPAPASLMVRLAHFVVGPRSPRRGEDVTRDQGRRVLEFPIGEPAVGLFVRISGRVEFERADIGFSDGSMQSVDAFGMRRQSGLYALADFDHDREVQWVRLILRARSNRARVGVLVGV